MRKITKPNFKTTEGITLIIFSCFILICSVLLLFFQTNQNQTLVKGQLYNFGHTPKMGAYNYSLYDLEKTSLAYHNTKQYAISKDKMNPRLIGKTTHRTFLANQKQASLGSSGGGIAAASSTASSNQSMGQSENSNTFQAVTFSTDLLTKNQSKESVSSFSKTEASTPMNAMAEDFPFPGDPGDTAPVPLNEAWVLLLFGGLWAIWQGGKSRLYKH